MSKNDDPISRAMVGKMMQEHYDADPPDVSEWVRALKGCAELYQIAMGYLEADPPNYEEALRCLTPAVKMGIEIRQQAYLSFVLSGEATDSFMRRLSESLKDQG